MLMDDPHLDNIPIVLETPVPELMIKTASDIILALAKIQNEGE